MSEAGKMMKCKDVSEFDGGCMTGSEHLQTAALVGVLGLEESASIKGGGRNSGGPATG